MPLTFKRLASKEFILKLIAFGVFINGSLIVYSSLLSHLIVRDDEIGITTLFSLSLVIGISLIYLSTLINRRKYLAWIITLIVYSGLFSLTIFGLLQRTFPFDVDSIRFIRGFIIPGIIVIGLIFYRDDFKVKSDTQSFKYSLRFSAIILTITFLYGLIGFQLLDKNDFHQQISVWQSMHYTLDQFGLTTNEQLTPYTGRAKLFLFTLSLVSFVSLVYIFISLFQPIKARFKDQTHQREHMMSLLDKYGGSSEDFFKVWPRDKSFLFSKGVECGIAFRAERGVVLCIGDPVGSTKNANKLMQDLDEMCLTNDWLPAFIHTEPKWSKFYQNYGFKVQKIGEEAIVNLENFNNSTVKNKYFRNITNKYKRMEYRTELLLPPHSQSTLNRLKDISDQWLSLPGREERGIMMGYFDIEYVQSCPIFVAIDNSNKIQCFLNQVYSYDKTEANYDLLRYANDSPGNINDYLLINFAKYSQDQDFKTLNLGLSPLAGISDSTENSVVDSGLKLLYSQGDRFYSFKGLQRFKQKYEPNWQDRFIAYKGGLRGLTKTANALNRAMSHSAKHKQSN